MNTAARNINLTIQLRLRRHQKPQLQRKKIFFFFFLIFSKTNGFAVYKAGEKEGVGWVGLGGGGGGGVTHSRI